MPRRNRVDPFGDLHAASGRGMFTGNRGCLVDDDGSMVRHHRGTLWITCVLSYRGWRSPLARPGHWTPLFFLDDAVALAAGHRPCGLCRRDDYRSYQRAVTEGTGSASPVPAAELNRMLAAERLRRGRGLDRAADRKRWVADPSDLPDGTVILHDDTPRAIAQDTMWEFGFSGWHSPVRRPVGGRVEVLTPPTSVIALRRGFMPRLHDSISTFA